MYKKTKKKKLPVLKIIRAFVLAGCVFTVVLNFVMPRYSPSATGQNSSYAWEVKSQQGTSSADVSDPQGLLNEEQRNLLLEYAQMYADTLTNLETEDISSLFTRQEESFYINKTALDLLVKVRKMSSNDLSLESCDVTYTVQRAEPYMDEVVVYVNESNRQKFRHLSDSSYSYNIYHIFTLKQSGGRWLIFDHDQEEDFYLLAYEGWDDAAGDSRSRKAESALNILIADAEENVYRLSEYQQGSKTVPYAADTSYDRQAAINYAKTWVNERNQDDEFLIYDDYGGNCQNYVSQCLHAGGLDMDYTGYGEQQWKFYSNVLNNRQTASGRSYSWIGVDEFYTYACSNDSTGLVCMPNVTFDMVQPGDVIHVGAYYKWRHALLATDVIKAEDGSVKDITVASNTADRWNYPLSAYIYTASRVIHIVGQN